jgi:hypothetical protein
MNGQDTSVTKDFVDRAIQAERRVTDKQFESRDTALALLAAGVNNQRGVHLAIGLAIFSMLLPIILRFFTK